MKKLKYQYKQSVHSNPHDYFWQIYPNVRSSMFKEFSTHQERSFYFLHVIEYKNYPLKIRVARGAGLPHVGMIFQAMSIKLPKAGSTIPEDSISTTKNMSKNKK